MLVNFNLERLEELLYHFYQLTGMTVSIWDAEFHQLSFQPKEIATFCKIIKSFPEGERRCFESDKDICLASVKNGKPTTHYCHAGLLDTAVPIRFKEQVIGYIMFGQVSDKKDKTVRYRLQKLGLEIGADPTQLLEAYLLLDDYDQETIASAATILKMATRYLWLSDYIEIGYNAIASQIDDFIRSHLNEDISVQRLCDVFGLSKNKLYELSDRWFRMPIGSYITEIRVTEAKRLLTTTELPVSQIGPLVGIQDYNYFTKFFKSHTGIPPLKYRKTYPFYLPEEEPQ